jgi:thioredoxin 1
MPVAVATKEPAVPAAVPAPRAVAAAAKPRLLELGSMRCQACLEMAKVLDALRASQGENLQVDFIDVFEQPEAADRHKISLIPTQILFDPSGKEIFRHTGYFSHDDILAKFRELGVRL